jgi:hypothetical protein
MNAANFPEAMAGRSDHEVVSFGGKLIPVLGTVGGTAEESAQTAQNIERFLASRLVAKALSVRQPWAWLIVNGFKPLENRTRNSHFRGDLLIHASAGMTRADHEACLLFCRSIGVLGKLIRGRRLIIPAYEELERGGIVGRVRMVDCVTHHRSKWFTGDYGYLFEDAKPLPFKPCKGILNFFEVTL